MTAIKRAVSHLRSQSVTSSEPVVRRFPIPCRPEPAGVATVQKKTADTAIRGHRTYGVSDGTGRRLGTGTLRDSRAFPRFIGPSGQHHFDGHVLGDWTPDRRIPAGRNRASRVWRTASGTALPGSVRSFRSRLFGRQPRTNARLLSRLPGNGEFRDSVADFSVAGPTRLRLSPISDISWKMPSRFIFAARRGSSITQASATSGNAILLPATRPSRCAWSLRKPIAAASFAVSSRVHAWAASAVRWW